jgi:hypothetical protein
MYKADHVERGDGDLYNCESGDVLGEALYGIRFGVPYHQH